MTPVLGVCLGWWVLVFRLVGVVGTPGGGLGGSIPGVVQCAEGCFHPHGHEVALANGFLEVLICILSNITYLQYT